MPTVQLSKPAVKQAVTFQPAGQVAQLVTLALSGDAAAMIELAQASAYGQWFHENLPGEFEGSYAPGSDRTTYLQTLANNGTVYLFDLDQIVFGGTPTCSLRGGITCML